MKALPLFHPCGSVAAPVRIALVTQYGKMLPEHRYAASDYYLDKETMEGLLSFRDMRFGGIRGPVSMYNFMFISINNLHHTTFPYLMSIGIDALQNAALLISITKPLFFILSF
jgi:hypothetical protein